MGESHVAAPDVVVLAGYGTTRESQRAAVAEPLVEALAEGFSGARLTEALTSAKVRRVLERRGEDARDVAGRLREAAEAGARRVLVQSCHVVDGMAFGQARAAVGQARADGAFERIELGRPLLATAPDAMDLSGVLDARLAQEPGVTHVLMGHGADRAAGLSYAALGYRMVELGRDDVVVGSMHGYPGFDAVLALLARRRAQDRAFGERLQVDLAPLMLSAGAHAALDMAGEGPGSWRSRLEAAGYGVEPRLEGLGSLSEVRSIIVAHAREAWYGTPSSR